uniref:Coiled-coil domain containing 78 n=1 Tax=Pundamilia nyererei TaxID=303518 RepID=A0A3B4EU25_9CICH
MDGQDQNSNQLQERVQALTGENLQWRGKYERVLTKVGYLETRLSHLASSNTDLSCRLVQSEEERLKIYKELVEEKIKANKIREQYEEETFELKTKVRVFLQILPQQDWKETSGQDLTEEYATLKKNYQILAEVHDKELAKSGALTAELLVLAQAQDALRRQLEEQHQCVKTSTEGLHGELDRVRALITRMSHDTLLENQDEIKDKLEEMKSSYKEQQKKLEEKVCECLSFTCAKALMCSQRQLKEAEEENSKLQLQVKELIEEYRTRLVCYLQDIADYIDGLEESKRPSEPSKMRGFIDSMLQDVRLSYRAREEQLATAARSYKKRLQRITQTHHALLIAYRLQREQILAKPENGLDPGPPEAHFNLERTELKDAMEKELQQLHQDKARLEGQLQAAWEQVQRFEESCGDIRKQLKEFHSFKQVSFEKERALLMTRATVAEAQVLELQDYIEKHLRKLRKSGNEEEKVTMSARNVGEKSGVIVRASRDHEKEM